MKSLSPLFCLTLFGLLTTTESVAQTSTQNVPRKVVDCSKEFAKLNEQRFEARTTLRTKFSFHAILAENVIMVSNDGSHTVGRDDVVEYWKEEAADDAKNPQEGLEVRVSVPQPIVRQMGRGGTFLATLTFNVVTERRREITKFVLIEHIVIEEQESGDYAVVLWQEGDFKMVK